MEGVASAKRREEKKMLETFEVGRYKDGYEFGFLIGRRFSHLIKRRVAGDLILHHHLLPFAQTPQAQPLLQALSSANREKFPAYWNEMIGTAEGSGISVLDIMLLNLRKEILPFLPEVVATPEVADDCSDILIVSDSMAVAAHNEDANVALVDHTYLIKATMSNGLSFTAYTYAGELPTCAFGFNSHGLAFTLDSVPPSKEEILAGGIGRNFISRNLLEATSIEDALSVLLLSFTFSFHSNKLFIVTTAIFFDLLILPWFRALQRIQTSNASVGHSYNLVDMRNRKILNVETASRYRISVHEVGSLPFFHANMYRHLDVQQVQDENSIERQRRAALLSVHSPEEMLSLLGDSAHGKHPIYMAGPTLYTLCTVLIDLDKLEISIFQGNPKLKEVSHTFTVL